MNVPFSIARRYLFSKGNRNVINIISGIAALGVGIGTLAMIIVLSAFNGLETLVADLYTAVDPDIRVAPIKGKVFSIDSLDVISVLDWNEIESGAPILEETAFVQFDDQQNIVTLRGIPANYIPYLKLDDFVVEGDLLLNYHGVESTIVGFGIADNLNLFIRDETERIKVFAAKRDGLKSMNPDNKFETRYIMPAGIVALNPEFDYKYLYTSFEFAEDILNYSNQASYLDLTLKDGVKDADVKARLQAHFGDGFTVKTRIELNDVIFKTNATEKWVTFFILSFIMVVATFNMVGSLTMLIIEKRKDISLLRSIGSSVSDIQRIFLFEGILITVLGAISGLAIGVTIILLQQYLGFFPLEGGIVEFYPVELEVGDVLAVCSVSLGIGIIASSIPVAFLLKESRLQAIST